MLPLTTYERLTDEARYLAACESGRIQKDYAPLATLLAEWEESGDRKGHVCGLIEGTAIKHALPEKPVLKRGRR